MLKIKLLAALVLALSAFGLNSAALAHGAAEPQHGGIVQEINDVSFELVVEADGVSLYLVDHDAPMASKGISGKLTVLNGGAKSEAELKAAGANKLRATGIKASSGAKIVAVLKNVDGKTVTLRFSVK